MKKVMLLACGLALGSLAIAQGRDAPARDPLPRGFVVDAAGKVVGRYIREDGEQVFALARIGGVVTNIPLGPYYEPDGRRNFSLMAPRQASRGAGVLFTEVGCTGTPYLWIDLFLGGMPSDFVNTDDGRVLLYVASSPVTVTVATQSRLRSTGECINEFRNGEAVPVGQQIDLLTTFQVPYSLR